MKGVQLIKPLSKGKNQTKHLFSIIIVLTMILASTPPVAAADTEGNTATISTANKLVADQADPSADCQQGFQHGNIGIGNPSFSLANKTLLVEFCYGVSADRGDIWVKNNSTVAHLIKLLRSGSGINDNFKPVITWGPSYWFRIASDVYIPPGDQILVTATKFGNTPNDHLKMTNVNLKLMTELLYLGDTPHPYLERAEVIARYGDVIADNVTGLIPIYDKKVQDEVDGIVQITDLGNAFRDCYTALNEPGSPFKPAYWTAIHGCVWPIIQTDFGIKIIEGLLFKLLDDAMLKALFSIGDLTAGFGHIGGLVLEAGDTDQDLTIALHNTNGPSPTPPHPPCNPCLDRVNFIQDVTFPDGATATPGQSLRKVWRVKNTGTSTWDGYNLIFTDGDPMGGISPKALLPIAPIGELDISLDLRAPNTSGRGCWQIVNRQGVYVPGGRLCIALTVVTAGINGGSGHIAAFSASPGSPSNASMVILTARVNWWPQFRAIRIRAGNDVIGETASIEGIFTWNAANAPRGDQTLVLEVATQTDTAWSNPERQTLLYTLNGAPTPENHAPNRPNPRNPYDWYVYYSGNTATLCAQADGDPDGDTIMGYQFDIFASAELWNSGWVSNNCATTRAMGPYNYQWRVKVRDSRGAESEWSDAWRFSLVNQDITINQLYFQPQDINSEVVKIRACTDGLGGVSIAMRASVNDANDGSDRGQWHIIKELGVSCFNDIDAPEWHTLGFDDGPHRVRVEAFGNTEQTQSHSAVHEEIFTLPHRRPAEPSLLIPVPPEGTDNVVYLNRRQVTFRWAPVLRAQNYTLFVSTAQSPKDNPNVVNQTVGSDTTEFTLTFDQDYPLLYWQVRAINDAGAIDSVSRQLGLDRQPPLCTIQSLSNPVWESVFQVNWYGTDNLAGIQNFDIQFMDLAQGDWNIWLSNAPAGKTYALFTGQPGHSYAFRCQASDNANNQNTYPANADSTVTIDVNARPPTPWWNTAYAFKRNVIIQNSTPNTAIPNYYPIHLHFDQTTTPTAAELYTASAANPKCSDLRIVYYDVRELDRIIQNCTSNAIDLWFRTQVSIHSSIPNTAAHQLYYGNPNASAPPANPINVWPGASAGDVRAYLAMQEGSGNTATDASNYGNHCSFDATAIPWTPNGKFGAWSLSFPNPPDGGGLGCGSNGLNTPAFTAEAWINYAADGWFLSNTTSGGQERWIFRITGAQMDLMVYQGGGSETLQSSISVPQNSWHHVAVSFDGDRTARFYLDGVVRATVTKSSSGIRSTTVPLRIGAIENFGRLRGKLAFIKISNGVVSSFPQGYFAQITTEPTVAVGAIIKPPTVGASDPAVLSLNSYPSRDGGVVLEVLVQNQGNSNTQNGFYTDLYADHQPTGPGDFIDSIARWSASPVVAGAVLTLTTLITPGDIGSPSVSPLQEINHTLYVQTDSAGVIAESNEDNNSALPVQICFAASDAYENDNNLNEAKPLLIGTPQIHNLHRMDDQDWMRFDAQAGIAYTIATENLGPNSDTYLYLYNTDGVTLVASNDDANGSLASQLEWQAPTTGVYYVLIKHWNPNVGGCATRYTVRLTRSVLPNTPTPTTTPTLAPMVTPAPPTNTPAPPTPTPTVTSVIFADGFELGNLSAWSSSANAGSLSVTTLAALADKMGLQVGIKSNTAIYLSDDQPNAELRYRVRFYLDPNSITMASGDAHYIFYGYAGASKVVLRMELRFSNNSYQLQAALLNNSSTWTTSGWFTITDAPHFIEFDWQAANAAGVKNGSLTLWIDGTQKASLTGIDNNTRRIDRIQLGAVNGIDSGTRGVYYFDAFESRRQTYIGPASNSVIVPIQTAVPLSDTTPIGLNPPSTVISTTVQPNTSGSLTGNISDLKVNVFFPANTTNEPLTFIVAATDNHTAPDGFTILGSMMNVQGYTANGAPLTIFAPQITVKLGYDAIVDKASLPSAIEVQAWDPDAGAWKIMPAEKDDEHVNSVILNQPTTLILAQKEDTPIYEIYLPVVQK